MTIILLIEPVWNWNIHAYQNKPVMRTFNRTRLELKLINLRMPEGRAVF